MSVSQHLNNLIKEIRLFIQYAVAEEDISVANSLVDSYRTQRKILNLLRQYYVALPDAREEPAISILKLIQRQGVTLYLLKTPSIGHLYAATTDEVVWLGEYPGELDPEMLAFWGFADQEELAKLCNPGSERGDGTDHSADCRGECPVCGVEEGELHLLGCSVEVCPWCQGQLNRCNCRFEQLEAEVVDTDEQLERFLEMLVSKGRIPFQKHQAPYYPGTSDGLDVE